MSYDKILPFISDLAENNDREWFAANRDRYDAALAQVLDLTAELIRQVATFDSSIAYLQPKDCLFRIYRDIRFSPDKRPYKNHFGIYIAKNGGRKSKFSGYYLHLEQGNCVVSSGIWCPESNEIKHIRSVIDAEYTDLQDIVNVPDFVKFYNGEIEAFEKLKRPPMGYPADHPAIEWLKLKQWIVTHRFADSLLTSENLIPHIVEAMAAVKPFSDWCNSAQFD